MSDMMKALVKSSREPGIWMDEVPVPEIGPNDVLIRVRKTAICGTDIHICNWDEWAQKTVPVPMIIGHEYVGEIARSAARCTGFKVGQRVSGEGHIICGHCRNCRAGRRHLCRNTMGVGVNRPGSLRRVPRASPPSTRSRSPTTSPTRSPRSSIRSATPCTPRSASTWWARTC